MRKIEVKIRQFFWSLQMTLKPTTYDAVIYKGKKYYIKSSLCGHDIWDLYEKNFKSPTFKRIKGSELKVVHSIKRLKDVFNECMNFQKTSWQLIDCNKQIGKRLSYYNSNNIRF